MIPSTDTHTLSDLYQTTIAKRNLIKEDAEAPKLAADIIRPVTFTAAEIQELLSLINKILISPDKDTQGQLLSGILDKLKSARPYGPTTRKIYFSHDSKVIPKSSGS